MTSRSKEDVLKQFDERQQTLATYLMKFDKVVEELNKNELKRALQHIVKYPNKPDFGSYTRGQEIALTSLGFDIAELNTELAVLNMVIDDFNKNG